MAKHPERLHQHFRVDVRAEYDSLADPLLSQVAETNAAVIRTPETCRIRVPSTM